MRFMFTLVLLLFAAPLFGASQVTFSRGGSGEVSLIGGPMNPWGPKGRDADHATVAMNDDGDIVVAYHTTRDSFTPDLKQVEVAYFRLTPGLTPAQDSWTMVEQLLLGDVGHSPLFGLHNQLDVKCERPDVIAVGNKFFVVWTRRYDRNFNPPSYPQWQEPAVLECSWLEWNGASVSEYGSTAGLGFPLDLSYNIRECAGVPDAVVLKQPSGVPTVAVVYPRQFDFSYDPLTMTDDDTRIFDLAYTTCSIDSNNQVTSATVAPLSPQFSYDGSSGGAAGLVLPDLAPSSEDNAFWLTYEGQVVGPSSTLGIVRLEYWVLNGTGLPEFAKTFKTIFLPLVPILRRRPMLSSLPGDATQEVVSIAFNKLGPSSDSDVVYEQWQYDPTGPLFSRSPVPLNHEFMNGLFNEGKPSPLHGPGAPYLRRCYFTRSGSLNDGVYYYDLNSNQEVQMTGSTTAGRAAVSYNKTLLSSTPTDTVALAWEDVLYPSAAPAFKRIVLHVD